MIILGTQFLFILFSNVPLTLFYVMNSSESAVIFYHVNFIQYRVPPKSFKKYAIFMYGIENTIAVQKMYLDAHSVSQAF